MSLNQLPLYRRWRSRDDLIRTVCALLAGDPASEGGTNVLLAPRGLGKTVVLNEIEDAARAERGWLVVSVSGTDGDPIAETHKEVCRAMDDWTQAHGEPARRRLTSVSVGAAGLSASVAYSEEPEPRRTVYGDDLRRLCYLRDQLDASQPGAFRAGVLIHAGANSLPLGDRLYSAAADNSAAADTLWTQHCTPTRSPLAAASRATAAHRGQPQHDAPPTPQLDTSRRHLHSTHSQPPIELAQQAILQYGPMHLVPDRRTSFRCDAKRFDNQSLERGVFGRIHRPGCVGLFHNELFRGRVFRCLDSFRRIGVRNVLGVLSHVSPCFGSTAPT
ncbi:hypothetical protein [Candidatus Poriferisodalis sp.]|uniref:hypothetical protein n=1 Tax=Candidatus Poriferisodalis sp. TaxID=3101277 RepID=UPI003B016B64